VAKQPTVSWNESRQRWMAWVRFPDGSRRKVERIDEDDAEADLRDLLAERARADSPGRRRDRLVAFDEVFDAWIDVGAPRPPSGKRSRHAKKKAENTLIKIRTLLDGHVRPAIGKLKVDRTGLERLEAVFAAMDDAGLATSTIDHTWSYVNQALQHGIRHRLIKTNPAADVMLPEAKPAKKRKSLNEEQLDRLLRDGIPADTQPAMWITGLMCGLRPGEISGLRWRYLDIDGDEPYVVVGERAHEVNKVYVGQAEPKTSRKGAIGLHPLVVAALRHHRDEMKMLGLYDPEGFVFCTRNRTPISVGNLRRNFRRLCARADIEGDWTTYELRHSFVSFVSDRIDDLSKVADMVGHSNTRTTEGYRHPVRHTLPHAVSAWNELLDQAEAKRRQESKSRKAESSSSEAA
jgi:integrase